MSRWMDRWVGGWMDECEQMGGCIDTWMDCLVGWMDEWIGFVGGWMDDGLVDRWEGRW